MKTLSFVSLSRSIPLLLVAGTAHAQDPIPGGAAPQAAASTGKTDVANAGKFEAVAKPEAEAKDALELQILAGGAQATGNARSLSLTSSANFRIRREANQFTAVAAVNYGRASVDGGPVNETVDNQQARVRYDRFVAKSFGVFLAASGRRDYFQGLAFRLNVDPGVAYYFVDEEKQQLWGELGYDFQYDVRNEYGLDKARAAGATGDEVEKTKSNHFGRAFIGYNNAINDVVTFKTGVEYLQGLTDMSYWRLNWDNQLSSKIGGNFSLATTFTLKYDNHPLLGVRNTDTMTAVSLVYTLL